MPKTPNNAQPAPAPGPDSTAAPPTAETAAAMAKVRRLMIISLLTTAIAIAAVFAVIGYRFYTANNGSVATITNGTIFLPKGAHVDSMTVSAGRIVVTFDVGGVTQARMFDLKTLQQIGQLNIATQR